MLTPAAVFAGAALQFAAARQFDPPEMHRAVCVVEAYPAFSPDGRTIVFQSNAAGVFDLYTSRPDGSGRRLIVKSAGHDMTPVYSPDGSRIVFVSERDGDREVYLCSAAGEGQVNISKTPGAADIHPVWSRDGARIMFSSNREKLHDDDFDIYVMDADGGNVRRITRGPEVDTYASWSPDGSKIVTRRVIEGNNEVFVMDADGSNAVNLTNAPEYDGWPVWSPDGKRIAYATLRRNNRSSIWIMDADGGNKVEVFREPPGYDRQPAWSPNGRFIAFTRYTDDASQENAGIFVGRAPAMEG